MGASDRQPAGLEQSPVRVDDRNPETLSEALRAFLDFLASEALRLARLEASAVRELQVTRDEASRDVAGAPDGRRPPR